MTNKWFRQTKQDKDQVKKVDQEIENDEEEDSLDGGGKQTDREHRPKKGKPERDDDNDGGKGRGAFGLPDHWEPEPGADEIDDLLIFRSILLCLLFCTAPESTEMLSSGLWEHVFPII